MSENLYDKGFYENQRNSSYYAAKKILRQIKELYDFESVVDIGCGMGEWLKASSELGAATIKGYDGHYVSREDMSIDSSFFSEIDLEGDNYSIDEKYDLAICMEVIEHINQESGKKLINQLCNASNVVLFSAAIPFQGGTGHVNEAWPQQWIKHFNTNGFYVVDLIRPKFWHDESLPWWYRQNAFIFVKNKSLAATYFDKINESLIMPHSVVHPDLFLLNSSKNNLVDGSKQEENLLVEDTRSATLKTHSLQNNIIDYPCSNYYNVNNGDKCVSIIMRTQNRPILLARAIASVIEQTYANWHLYIINDGGDKKNVEKCVSLYKNTLENRVTILHHDDALGMEAASDSAVELIESEFAVVHDDDDSWEKEFLEECVDYLSSESSNNYGGVVTHTTLIRESVSDSEIKFIEECDFNNWYTEIDLYRLLGENTFAPISFMFRTKLFEEIGVFNKNLPVLGDWDFNIRALFTADIGVLPKKLAFYHHRVQSENNAYSNSVTQGINKHLRFNTLYRNSLLRKATKEAPWMLGFLINEAKSNHELNNRITGLEYRLDQLLSKSEKNISDMHELLHYHMSFKKEQIDIANQSLATSIETYKLTERIFKLCSTVSKPILFIKRKVFKIT
ncbi:glycosyltransferase [Erwinia billingiae]|uniref:glycosyltransferase n=1 Tax=Erwinia billingiae TaxID=182337 RepID=UPI0030D5EC95